MQKDRQKNTELYELVSSLPNTRVNTHVFKRGRYLVGSTQSCDVVISSASVSPVHAVLEFSQKGIKLFDMNSKKGTFVNGKKALVVDLKESDKINFGEAEFTLTKYVPNKESKNVLPILDPVDGNASVFNDTQPNELPSMIPELDNKESEVPYIVYPLSDDKKADYSEYIFEDKDELFPIFHYQLNKQSIEVIILYHDKVYSVDYIPEKNTVYNIAGLKKNKKQIEFPYLGKNESVPFIEINSGNCLVNQLHMYDLFHLTENGLTKCKDPVINLQENDIVRLQKEHLEIYVRRVSSPPKVKAAPFFRRDPALRKYVLLALLFVFTPLLFLNFYEVDEEMKKEKDPERIATILYKQKLNVSINKAVEKSEVKKKVAQKTPKKKVVKKEKISKPAPKVKQKTAPKVTKDPGKKMAPKKQVVKKVKRPAPKRKIVAKTKSASSVRAVKTAKTRRAVVRKKSPGRVDTYRPIDFRSTVSSLVAKGGSLRGANTSASVDTSDSSSTSISGGVATNIKKANVGSEVGSLTGSTVGKLGQSRGSEGLTAKTGAYVAGIPSDTVVLGSMDPDVIRRILRENLPQFRYCYQRELDQSNNKNLSGIIKLIFTIGASGHVSKAGVGSGSRFPGHVKRCVVNVLRGIKFPRPLGGGTVDVKQPFNFFPKKL